MKNIYCNVLNLFVKMVLSMKVFPTATFFTKIACFAFTERSNDTWVCFYAHIELPWVQNFVGYSLMQAFLLFVTVL